MSYHTHTSHLSTALVCLTAEIHDELSVHPDCVQVLPLLVHDHRFQWDLQVLGGTVQSSFCLCTRQIPGQTRAALYALV